MREHDQRVAEIGQDTSDGDRDRRRDGVSVHEEIRAQGPGRSQLHGRRRFNGEGGRLRNDQGHLREGLLSKGQQGPATRQMDGAGEFEGRCFQQLLGRVELRRCAVGNGDFRVAALSGSIERAGAL